MPPGRRSILIFLLLGWMGLSPALSARGLATPNAETPPAGAGGAEPHYLRVRWTLRTDGHHRAGGALHHLVGHAAENRPIQALPAMGAHDD